MTFLKNELEAKRYGANGDPLPANLSNFNQLFNEENRLAVPEMEVIQHRSRKDLVAIDRTLNTEKWTPEELITFKENTVAISSVHSTESLGSLELLSTLKQANLEKNSKVGTAAYNMTEFDSDSVSCRISMDDLEGVADRNILKYLNP